MDWNTYECDLAAGEEDELGGDRRKWNADLEVVTTIKASGESSARAVAWEGAMSGEDGRAKVAVVIEGHDEMIMGSIGGWILVNGRYGYGGSTMMELNLRGTVR
jgi:hypothetical protein